MSIARTVSLGLIIFFLTSMSLSSVLEGPLLPSSPYNYSNIVLPNHLTTDSPTSPLPTSVNGTDNTPNDNPITDHGATLGLSLIHISEPTRPY